MIDSQLVSSLVEDMLENTDAFLVGVKVSPANDVVVTIDSSTSLDVDTCARLTRALEDALPDRELEDYSLEVGSAGLTAPFTVRQQYEKNVGNPVDVLTRDGRKLRGVLTEVNHGADGELVAVVDVPTKVKEAGMKRPELRQVRTELPQSVIKSISYHLEF